MALIRAVESRVMAMTLGDLGADHPGKLALQQDT